MTRYLGELYMKVDRIQSREVKRSYKREQVEYKASPRYFRSEKPRNLNKGSKYYPTKDDFKRELEAYEKEFENGY